MIDVVIVDDENIVRLGMRSIINWEEQGFKVAGVFSNGKDAFDYCVVHKPGLLITDIKMQTMDGIELIREIKRLDPEIIIIVLSNYDDFQYVSDAFKIGVKDYLLKQFIEPEKLLDILQAIRCEILNKAPDISEGSGHGDKSAEREEYLHSLFFGSEPLNQDICKKLDELGLDISKSVFYCLSIRLYKRMGDELEDYQGVNPSLQIVKNTVSDCINKYCCAGILTDQRNILASVVFFDNTNKHTDMTVKLKDMIKDICETLNNYFDLHAYIGISGEHQTLPKLRTAFAESGNALDSLFFTPAHNTVYFDKQVSIEPYPENLLELEKEIYLMMNFYELQKLKDCIVKFISMHQNRFITRPDEFKKKIAKFIQGIDILVFKELKINLTDLPDNSGQKILNNIQSAKDISAVYQSFSLLLDKVSEHISKSTGIIHKAKSYIEENYMKDIGLAEISKYLSINSTYFCQLFKEKTGENFSSYLSRIRIEKSIELLKRSQMSTEEIAESIGYLNTNYFIKIFKKVTGKTISEFKKNL